MNSTPNRRVQSSLRWGCDIKTADRICNSNRHVAEFSGYFETTTFFKDEIFGDNLVGEITFYDSNTGKPLFIAPRGRTFEEFISESRSCGYPSFRDREVVWDHVRCLKDEDGVMISTDGTHLGHNLPDRKGNRYNINLVSIAGRPHA